MFRNSHSYCTSVLVKKKEKKKNLKINGRRKIRPTWMKPVPTLWKKIPLPSGDQGQQEWLAQGTLSFLGQKKKVVQFVHVAAGVCLSGCTCACGWDRFGNSSYISRDRGRKRDETVNENLGEVMLAWGEKS